MSTYYVSKKKISNYLYPILIVFFSFFVNWNYSKYGVFPIDTFLHYDSAYRILNGEYPIRDFWIVSGIFVDFLQALFFKLFNINWYAYIIHSSIFNVIISFFTFHILIKKKLKKEYAFFYSISFALLAYPVSGTPFVDLHATFFSVLAIYFTFLAIEKPTINLNWFLIVLFYFFSFLSKQVPAAYFIVLNFIIILPYLIVSKKFKPLIIIFLSLSFFLALTFFLLSILNINFKDFYIQYFDYPRDIGSERLNIFNISLKSIISNYKFILIPIFFLLVIKLKKLFTGKINFYSKEFTSFLIFLSLLFCLVLHQTLTKNQVYIQFLIPLSFAFLHFEIQELNLKSKIFFKCFIVLCVILLSIKYHIRFNEDRKFHELVNVDISKAVDATYLDQTLKGLLWISPSYNGGPQEEIKMLKRVKNQIEKKENEIILITNYLFLDSITSKNLNSPSRTHTMGGDSLPQFDNKHFTYYKNFLEEKVKKKNIEEVYFIKSEEISRKIFIQFFDKSCYSQFEDDIFIFYKLDQECIN